MIKYSSIKESNIRDINQILNDSLSLSRNYDFINAFHKISSTYDCGIKNIDLIVTGETLSLIRLFFSKSSIYVAPQIMTHSDIQLSSLVNSANKNICSIINFQLRNYVNNNLI